MATAAPPSPCSSPEVAEFDFWIGEWNLIWPAAQTGGTVGEVAKGTNRIERLFERCVIAEHFATADDSFLGRSWSVFDPAAGVWRQTWVDNRGGYLVLTGGFDGEKMELRTDATERDGELVVNRMVFSDIRADSLAWAWQRSTGGESWDDLWTISYRRRV